MAISRRNSRSSRIQCLSMVAFLLSRSSVVALKTFTSCVHRVRRHHHTSTITTSSSLGGILSSAFATPHINGNHFQRYNNNNLLLHRRSRIIQQQQTACYATTNDGDITKLTVKELKDVLRNQGLPTSGLKAELIERLSSTTTTRSSSTDTSSSATHTTDNNNKTTPIKKKQPPKSSKRKFTINPNWQKEFDVDAITNEFDDMAKKEGFDTKLSYYADDVSFEDDFTDDDYNILDDDDDDMLDDDDIPDLGPSSAAAVAQSMEERLAAAKRDSSLGRVSVPETLDTFSQNVSFEELQKLGFRREVNPYGNDETPRRAQFKVISGSMTCSGCGSDFQSDDELRPGFLPNDKYVVQTKLLNIEEAQKVQEKADSDEWSTDDEIDWLLSQTEPSSGGGSEDSSQETNVGDDDEVDLTNLSVDEMARALGLDSDILSQKKPLCKRCHRLQNFGSVEQKLRPGWTDEPTLSQEQFRKLLLPLREKKAVILALVDLFDFSGSVLPELDEIAGDNPVILAANKADLLPSEMGQQRAENWVRRELEYMNVQSIANIGGAVRLVSCKTGFGIPALMEKARKLADDMDADIYIVGAANAGKSTLVNYLLEDANPESNRSKFGGRKRAGNANKWKGSVTTSPLPGTTLEFIKIEIGKNLSLYDTPGLLVPGCLTERLTPEELKIVVPKKKVEPITFRIASGKCCLVGGLAKIEVVGDCKPFLFTFFVANDIKLHMTDSTRAEEFTAKHVGKMLTPPLEPGPERMEEIGEFEYHEIDIKGEGWKQAAADITLRGLGWVAVTGAGVAKLRIGVPKGIGLTVRPPLMPFDVWEGKSMSNQYVGVSSFSILSHSKAAIASFSIQQTNIATAKYTGGRSVRKSGKSRSGKRRKGVGRN